jgi:hypothetical protein
MTLQNLWLLFLFLLWAVLLFGGGVIGKPDADQTRRMPRWTRMLSSFVLVLAAWSYALMSRVSPYADVSVLVALGMTLGFLGDLFMAKLILKDERHVLGGIGAFGLGHLAYIAAFLLLGDRLGLDASVPRWGTLAAFWLLGVICWYGVIYRPSAERGALHLASLPYALLLSTTAGIAAGLALQDGRLFLVALGALLFLISDLILAARLFNNLYFRWINDWVWLTYGPAQMLIVFGTGILIASS